MIELLTMTVDLFSIVFGLRIGEAIFRYHAEYSERREQNEVISSALWLVAALTTAGLLVLEVFAAPLSEAMFGDRTHTRDVMLFATTLPLAALMEVAFLYIRAEQRPWLFVSFSTLRLMLQLSLNIYFVVIQGLRVEGVVYSSVLSSAIMAGILVAYTVGRTVLRFSSSKAKQLAVFSWPLIFNAIGMFYATMGDRYFLRVFADLSQVGIYSLGYKFGFFLIMFAWNPFGSVWAVERYAVLRGPEPQQVFNRAFTFISVILITAALVLAVFAEDTLRIMSDAQFWPAASVVPVVVVAYVLQAWMGFSNVGLLLKHKTIQIFYSTAVSCLLVTVAYVTLIPLWGAMGAAVGTLLGFIARFVWIYRASRACYDMGLQWGKVGKMSALAVVVYAVSLLAPDELLLTILVHGLEVMAFLVLLLVLPILSEEERIQVIGIVKKPQSIVAAIGGRSQS